MIAMTIYIADEVAEQAKQAGITEITLSQVVSRFIREKSPHKYSDNASTHFKKKSMAGALAQYANPTLIEKEKSAWAMAMKEKHDNH